MEANVGSGINYFKFRIDLKKQEAEKITKLMKNCPDPDSYECNCPAHDFLDKFDKNNINRRVILEDEHERWV